MAGVLGVGGIFFKAQDVPGVSDWYRRVLGFELQDWGGMAFPPLPRGVTVWSPFKADTEYFAPSTHPFMINFVVDDLDAVLDRVETQGVEVLGRDDQDGMGRFAWIMDPAGTKIELWEPKAEPAEEA